MKRRPVLTALFALSLLLAPASARAQTANKPAVPAAPIPEVLIKTTILTLNDANVTGNYTVLYARFSKLWQGQTSAEKLAGIFKGFRDSNTELWAVADRPRVRSQ